MKRFPLLSKLAFALAFGLSFAGCHWGRPETPNYPPIDIESAKPRWKFIGIKKDPAKACPTVEGWHERPLFDSARQSTVMASALTAGGRPTPSATLQRELSRFCVFEAKNGVRPAPPGSPELEGIASSDAVALTPAGFEDTVQPRLSAYFFEQVGRPGIRPLLLPFDQSKPRVRLAFIDSHPTDEDFRGLRKGCASGHGDFLRHLGHALTCERGACMTKITTRLALPIRRFDRDSSGRTVISEECGGFIGSFENLADAIVREVDDWQEENALLDPDSRSRLVINLSINWDSAQFGGLEESVCAMREGPRAVYNALAYAHAFDALVIAAVGNDRSGPSARPGPLLPAAWEAPLADPGCAEPRTRPLLYAVGGLRSDNLPLANSQRLNSMPGLAAYADHAALGIFLPNRETSTYTGTSVAAAVVSSIAAVVWHEMPDLSPQGVIETLRAGGTLLDFAEAQRTPGTRFVWRVALCPALHRARGDLTPCPAPDPAPLMFSDLLDDSATSAPAEGWNLVTEIPAGCHRATYRTAVAVRRRLLPEDLCPSDVLEDFKSESWLHPAPANEPCPSCTDPPHRPLATIREGSGGYRSLHIEVRDDWSEWIVGEPLLESATLEIKVTSGDLTRYFIPGPFSDTRSLAFPVPATGFDSGAQVTLNWKVRVTEPFRGDRLYSIRTPVFIAD